MSLRRYLDTNNGEVLKFSLDISIDPPLILKYEWAKIEFWILNRVFTLLPKTNSLIQGAYSKILILSK